MLFLIMYSYKTSFYHNDIKARQQRSPTKQQKNCLKYCIFLKKSKYFFLYFVNCIQFNKGCRNNFIKSINTLLFYRVTVVSPQNQSTLCMSTPIFFLSAPIMFHERTKYLSRVLQISFTSAPNIFHKRPKYLSLAPQSKIFLLH